jgi:hypothetical protein
VNRKGFAAVFTKKSSILTMITVPVVNRKKGANGEGQLITYSMGM